MIGVITGLTAEARLAAPLGRTRAGGGTPAGAAQAAAQLITEGATALISFGLAGGLDPALAPGSLLIPDTVLTEGVAYRTNPALTRALGGPLRSLYAGTALAVTAAEKSALRAATGADAIDLESGAVGKIAAEYGLPFAVLRAVCDPAGSTLPAAAMIALDARGAIALARVIASLARHPAQMPALLRLATHAAQARTALRHRIREIGQIKPE